MIKRNVEKVVCGFWVLNLAIFMASIMIPRQSSVFIIILFLTLVVFPFLLVIIQLGTYYQNNENNQKNQDSNEINLFSYLPFLGYSILICLCSLAIISSLEKFIIPVIIVFSLLFIGLNFLLGDLLFNFRLQKYSFKVHSWIMIIAVLQFLLFIGIMVVLAYDYSLV